MSEDTTKLWVKLLVSDGTRPSPGGTTPDGRDMQRYLTAALAFGIPAIILSSAYFGLRVLAMVVVAVASSLLVEAAFAKVRRKALSGGTVAFAVLLVLMLPPDIPLWMTALGAAFGTLFGKEVFGGTGTHIFCPVLVGKGFLMFSYPQVVLKGSYFGSMLSSATAPFGWLTTSTLILLGGLAMVRARPMNLRIMTSIMAGAVCLAVGLAETSLFPFRFIGELFISDGFLLGACLLACDPACSPRNDEGKWLYGLLIGASDVLMRSLSNYSEAMMSAILIGNTFAPTIDALSHIRLGRGDS